MSHVLDFLSEKSPLYRTILEQRPDRNALAILCGELEDRVTRAVLGRLQNFGFECVCLAYD
eukprot:10044001-Lingulodinium_polyedra.AAC.1